MSIYKPTYLYIKQHSITGKLYFGKTTVPDPNAYLGSGKYWTRHINKHGKEHVVTLWFELFDDIFELVAFAISFSNKMNIVKSEQWLNLMIENGIDGGFSKLCMDAATKANTGRIHSNHEREKRINSNRGQTRTIDTITKMRKPKSESHKNNMKKPKSESHKNNMRKPQLIIICPHCGKSGGKSNMRRYHFDKCKLKLINTCHNHLPIQF